MAIRPENAISNGEIMKRYFPAISGKQPFVCLAADDCHLIGTNKFLNL